MLWFVSPSAALLKLVNDSVLLVMSGATVFEAVIALYILSLSPTAYDDTLQSLAPLRLISLATSVGQSLDLDALEDELDTGTKGVLMLEPVWESRLEQLLVWQTVKNRYNMSVPPHRPSPLVRYADLCSLTIMQGRSRHLLNVKGQTSPSPGMKYHFYQVMKILQLEAELVDMCRDLVKIVCALESYGIGWEVPDIGKLEGQWQQLAQRLKDMVLKHATDSRTSRRRLWHLHVGWLD